MKTPRSLRAFAAALVFCLLSGAASASVSITRTSSPTFYTDFASLNSMYVAYRITNTGATDYPVVYVTVGGFTGGIVSRAINESGVLTLGSLAAGQSKMAFFYLTASATTAIAQTHTITVLDGPVGIGTTQLAQNFTFTSVADTISSNSNKVTTTIYGPDPPGIGGIVTVTVTGDTGTIGSGLVGSYTPAAAGTWRSDVFQLISTSITLSGANTGVYNDTLLLPPTAFASTSDTTYNAIYRYRVIGTTAAATPISPVAYISSGANTKHTSNYGTLPPISATSNGTVLAKTVTPNTLVSSGIVTYTVRITNNSPTIDTSYDRVVDALPSTPANATYVSGSATYNGVAIVDPNLTGQTATWYGTFDVPAGTSRDLVYKVTIPNAGGSFVNSARAYVGTTQIDTTVNATDNAPATAAVTLTPLALSGTVFEDVNYGGGAGRTLAASSGSRRPGARVELFDSSGNFLSFTTTDASGNYTFNNVSPVDYTIRVVNTSVTSSRTGYVAGLLPVQTFRTNASTGTAVAVTDRIGGETPNLSDAGDGSTTLAALTTASTTAQSITAVTVPSASVTGLDFGFNFDTIVNLKDAGQGSLRRFIINTNALSNTGLAQAGLTAGIDNAVFMISNGTAAPGLRAAINYFTGGIATISPLSALPSVTDPVIIDGQKQPGWTSAPVVELNGTSAGAAHGISISAGNSTIRGLTINRFTQNGIFLNPSGGNTVQGCYLGTNAAGTAASANASGIWVQSPNNTIGGTAAAARNIISGNTNFGIGQLSASNNTIAGNYIGTNVTGTAAIANGEGVRFDATTTTTLGGTTAGAGNLISGNAWGVRFVNGSSGNIVRGNSIGLSSGGAALANNLGLSFTGGSNNTVGGTVAGAANNIAFNTTKGVEVLDGSTGNLISANSIHSNGALGLDLSTTGVTPNNGTKNAALGNAEMDFPVFATATLSGATLAVSGYVGSAAGQSTFANARIEIFKSDDDASGYGEGKTYLGFITADGSGNFATSLNVTGLAVGEKIAGTATDGSNNTSEFAANIAVIALGTNVTGTVYEDANVNVQQDAAETGTGLVLYVKLVNTSTPAGPASAAALVDPVTGAYTLTPVPNGTYTLVLDDNNTLSDVTPTIPPGWTATEAAIGLRTPVAVTNVPLPNQNFGLYHGLLVSGRVFADTGSGGGIANDGTLNGSETGIAGVVLKLTDTTGATVHSTATTNGAGEYALALPSSIAAGTALKIVETNSDSFISTGATVGNTVGTYDRATDTISFSVAANTTYTNVNFGDVPPNALSTDGQQSSLPGTVVYYPHTFAAGSAGSVTFSAANVQTPPLAGWTSTLYRDTNGNGQFDAGEPAITGPIAVATGEKVFLLVKVAVPTTATFGANDTATLSANFTYTGAAPALLAALSRKDVTTVGNPTTSGLRLNKTVDKPSALPGENITYTITYTNVSSDALRNVIIYDTTPAFTKFVSGANGPLPLDLTNVVLTAPAPGAAGAMRWTFAGTLSPGGTGTVSFVVKLDQ